MKAYQKSKNPYNPSPQGELKAQIVPSKLTQKSPQHLQESSSQTESSSYDSQVQQFANQFYDQNVQQADKYLQQNHTNTQIFENNNQQAHINNKNQNLFQNSQINQNLSQHQKLSLKLKQLKNSLNEMDINSILFKKKDQKKLKQIAQFLTKKHKQKKQFMKKLKKIKNSEKEKRKIQDQMIKNQQKQQHSRRIQQIRNVSLLIKQKIDKKKQDHQQKLQDIEVFYQNFYKKHRKQKLYKMMELSQKKKKNQEIQKQKDYLKQRKYSISQIVGLSEINEFKKRRQELKRDLEKVKQAQKEEKNSQIAQKNRQLRERIYISNRYLQLQEEQTKRKKIKLIPKEKLQKIKKYSSYIKQNFITQNNKNQDDQENMDRQTQDDQKIIEVNGKLYKNVKKDRYLNGERMGQKIETVPIPKTQRQIRMVGRSYLQQLKLMPKKRHSTSLDLSKIPDEKMKPMTSKIEIPKVKRKLGRISLSKNPNRHQIQNLIGSLKAKDQLIQRKQHYLKITNNGVLGKNLQKQALDQDFLDNIEKKIHLLGKL